MIRFFKEIVFVTTIVLLYLNNGLSQGLIIEEVNPDEHLTLDRQRADVIPKIASIKKYAPHTLTQQYSTCVAHSLASARTLIYARNNSITDKDKVTGYLFSPHWIYYNNKELKDKECAMGLSLSKTIINLNENGMQYMAFVEYPDHYPFTTVPLCGFYPPTISEDQIEAINYKIDNAYLLKNLEDVKLAISKGMPVVIGMTIPKSFSKAIEQKVWSPIDSDTESPTYGHAMLIVGYDDYKYGGSVEILNSWGTKWGDGGYIWIKYDDFLKYITSQVFALDAEDQIRFGATSTNEIDSLKNIDLILSEKLDSSTLSKSLLNKEYFLDTIKKRK